MRQVFYKLFMLKVNDLHTFTDLLTQIQNSRRQGRERFSYRQLADKLGYRSPRTLAMVHKGQRLPNHNLIRKIIHHFRFTPDEIELTHLLVEKVHAQKRQSSLNDLEKKIQSIKNKIELRSEGQEFFQVETLYFTRSEIDQAKNEIQFFLKEITSRYGNICDEKIKYQLDVKLFINTS